MLLLIEKIPESESIQALVLVPTRVGAAGEKGVFKSTTSLSKRLFVEAVFGGQNTRSRSSSKEAYPSISCYSRKVVGIIKRNSVNLRALKYLVLDEADEMIQMGFRL